MHILIPAATLCRALSKMVEIIEQVGGERMARRAARFGSPEYFIEGPDGKLQEVLDSQGNDTEYDSIDLMVRCTPAAWAVVMV